MAIRMKSHNRNLWTKNGLNLGKSTYSGIMLHILRRSAYQSIKLVALAIVRSIDHKTLVGTKLKQIPQHRKRKLWVLPVKSDCIVITSLFNMFLPTKHILINSSKSLYRLEAFRFLYDFGICRFLWFVNEHKMFLPQLMAFNFSALHTTAAVADTRKIVHCIQHLHVLLRYPYMRRHDLLPNWRLHLCSTN